jgi:hypothetical protein
MPTRSDASYNMAMVSGMSAAELRSVPARRAVRSEPGSRPCRGPGRYDGYMRVGDSHYLQVTPKTLQLAELQLLHKPTRAAAGAATRVQTEQVSDLTHGAPPPRSRPTRIPTVCIKC